MLRSILVIALFSGLINCDDSGYDFDDGQRRLLDPFTGTVLIIFAIGTAACAIIHASKGVIDCEGRENGVDIEWQCREPWTCASVEHRCQTLKDGQLVYQKRRRVLSEPVNTLPPVFFEAEEIPFSVQCFADPVCNAALLEYNLNDDSPENRNNRCSECNADEFNLFGQSVDEMMDHEVCVETTECVYIYVDDGVSRTWDEAQAFCESKDSNLATILTEEDLECACGSIVGSSPWTGMHGNHESKPYHMEYIDGSICPDPKICVVGEPFWLNGKPMKCEEGLLCVRLLPEFCKIDNDIRCNKTLTAVLCNGAGSRSARRRIVAQSTSELTISYPNDYDILNYGNMLFAGIVLCILISYVFGCYYCIYKKKRNDTTKREDVAMIENKL